MVAKKTVEESNRPRPEAPNANVIDDSRDAVRILVNLMNMCRSKDQNEHRQYMEEWDKARDERLNAIADDDAPCTWDALRQMVLSDLEALVIEAKKPVRE